jgi:predicted dehydrogenase
MDNKLKLGIIGAGGIVAKFHLPALKKIPDIDVVLISGRKTTRLEYLCKQYHIPNYTRDYNEVIDDPTIEAIIIATPHPLHVTWALKAVKAGKHVLIEKPLCVDMNEANDLAAEVQRSNCTVLTMPHFTDTYFLLRDLIQKDTVGRISNARCRVCHGGPETYYYEVSKIFGEPNKDDLWFLDADRAIFGALFDMGSYAVSTLVVLLGSVSRVSAFVKTFEKHTHLEDTAVLLLEFSNGATAVAETSWCDPTQSWELSIYGTTGKLVIGNLNDPVLMHVYPTSFDSISDPTRTKRIRISKDKYVSRSVHEHFLKCLHERVQPPLSNIYLARHVTEILLAGIRSARENRSVSVHSIFQ